MKKHVTIHKIPTPHKLERHSGEHNYKQGGWGYFVTEFETDEFAKSVSITNNLPSPTHCKICYGKQ